MRAAGRAKPSAEKEPACKGKGTRFRNPGAAPSRSSAPSAARRAELWIPTSSPLPRDTATATKRRLTRVQGLTALGTHLTRGSSQLSSTSSSVQNLGGLGEKKKKKKKKKEKLSQRKGQAQVFSTHQKTKPFYSPRSYQSRTNPSATSAAERTAAPRRTQEPGVAGAVLPVTLTNAERSC